MVIAVDPPDPIEDYIPVGTWHCRRCGRFAKLLWKATLENDARGNCSVHGPVPLSEGFWLRPKP